MRKRRAAKTDRGLPEAAGHTPVEPEAGDPRVKVVFVRDPRKMVTLEDPGAPIQAARGAFARLRPPETLGPVETRAWSDSVRAIAYAVRTLPSRRSAHLSTSTRVDVKPVGTVREEVIELVAGSGDLELYDIVNAIMSEVDRE